MRWFRVALLLLLSGCEGPPDAWPEGSPEVTGARIFRYLGRDGAVDVPYSLPDDLAAWTSAGEIPAVLYDDGTFSFSGVPPGEYLLRSTQPSDRHWPRFVKTSRRKLEFVTSWVGRPNQVTASGGTSLLLIDPPSDLGEEDRFKLLSVDAGAAVNLREPGPYVAKLIDASQGDRAWLVVHRRLAGEDAWMLTEARQLDDLVILDGETTPIDARLSRPATQAEVRFEFTKDAFLASRTLLGPSEGLRSDRVTALLHTAPPGAHDVFWHGLYSAAGPLETFEAQAMVGNPYPSDWPIVVSYGYWVTFSSEATLTTVGFGGEKEWDGRPLDLALGPIRNLRVNGLDAFQRQAGVGTRPVFAWDPPAIGEARTYHVTICQAENGREIGTLSTDEPGFTFPLDLDQPFFLLIEATTIPLFEVKSIPNASSKIATAVFTP